MKKYLLIFRSIVICSILLLSLQPAFAIDERYAALPLYGSLGQIKVDSVISVQDNVYFNPALKPNQTTYNVKNYLSLKINEAAGILLPDAFKVIIGFKIYAIKAYPNGVQYIDSSRIDSISVDYKKNGIYFGKSVFTFDGAYQATVKITFIKEIIGSFNDFAACLMMENEILVSRDYNFDCNNNVITTVNTDTGYLASKGELRVSWPKDRMADEYDLEWAYIDQSAMETNSSNGQPDPRKIFSNNASRVSIAAQEYFIPMLYDNTGTLFYRVRPVQIKFGGQRTEAKWSSDWISTGLGRYNYYGGHEPKLNWQATTSFAEEGKRKSVVQYYDGSLRSRQTVTKDNTTDTTIVAETLYDFQGRPVIQVLPAPSLSSMIKYSPNFNTDINNAEYDKTKYDDVLTNFNYCGIGAPAMGIQQGASNYYSPSNPSKNIGFNKFIPDARGFPFAQTRYTQDNTGRISSQGGVGPDHQIGKTDPLYNDSHETKYYYGNADQEELDALFGTEAGNAAHYFKNMVRDANGQYSVSYLDMHGRTIATALAGIPQTYLDSLASLRVITITKQMMDSVNNIPRGTAIESAKSLVVTKAGKHIFNYSLNPDSLRLNDCNNTPVCYDCLYNLTISITDDCNNQSLPGMQPYVITDSNFTLSPVNPSCNKAAGFNKQIEIFLKEGTYLVTKKLSVSKYGMDFYRDSVFKVKNTCKSLNEFIVEQRQLLLGQLECAPSCAKCSNDTFSNWQLYRPYFLNQLGIAPADTANYRPQAWTAFNKQADACKLVCGTVTLANTIRKQMLTDVSPPHGQYANPDLIDMNSIFAPSSRPNRYAYMNLAGFLDETGKPDTIWKDDGSYLFPQYLSIPEFVSNFKSSWAERLISIHPEYCKLQLFESNPSFTSSHLWDLRFAKINSYQQAKDSGFLNPLGYADIMGEPMPIIRDPFFNSSINPLFANTWRPILNDSMRRKAPYTNGRYLDIWSLATAMVQCDSGDVSCFDRYASNQHPFDLEPGCKGNLDMAWKYYRQMYLSLKSTIINKILSQVCNGQMNINVNTHTLNFPDPALQTKRPPATKEEGNIELGNMINNSCSGYVAQWWKELGPCNYTSKDTAIIFPRLRKVCMEGGDISHPFGSSTVSPGSNYAYKSFDDVIKAYNDSLATAPEPRVIAAGACNAYMISAPAAFDNRPAMYNQEIWKKPDSCTCSTINALYGQYQVNGKTDTSFSAYLWRTTGTQISNTVLDSLRNLCNGSITCKFLPAPIVLPPVLQCGIKDVCVSCTRVKDLYKKFQTRFPGIEPSIDNTDSLQRTKNILFEGFMNYNLGFGKQTNDYLEFMNNCGKLSTLSSCDSLENIVIRYMDRFKNYPNPDTVHFTAYDINNNRVKILTNRYKEIFSNGYAHITHSMVDSGIYKNSPLAIIKYDTLCVNNNFTVEARLKGDSSDMTGGRYCSALNFIIWDEFGNAFSPTFESRGAPGDCGAGTWHVRNSNGTNSWDTTNLAMYYRNQLNWYRIKMNVKNGVANIFVNDTLITTILYTVPFNKIARYAFGIGKGYVDYVKVYDSLGKVQYVEEFEDCQQSGTNYPAAFTCTNNCITNFVSYFNQERNSNYTYNQIDSIYNINCGKSPIVCNASFSPSIDSLKMIAEKFPCYYDYLDDATVNTQHPCNELSNWVSSAITDKGIWLSINRYYNLNISNGTFKTETSNSYSNKYGWLAYFAQYNQRDFSPQNHYSFEARFRNPGAKGIIALSTNGTGATKTGGVTVDEDFTISFIPNPGAQWIYRMRGQFYYFDPGPVSRNFDSFRVAKYSITPTKFQVFLDDTLILDIPRDGKGFIYSVNGFTVSSDQKIETLEMDWFKLYMGDTLVLSEDFNNFPNQNFKHPDPKYLRPRRDCKSAFVVYFNYFIHLGLNTFEKIEALYKSRGLNLVMPCAPTDTSYLCGKSQPQFPPIVLSQYSPCNDSTSFIITKATLKYQAYKDSLNNNFNDKYLAKCLNAYRLEKFTVTQPMSEFHYTLYYYDQAGNLVRTVPPEGVDISVFERPAYFDSVKIARANKTLYKPNHQLKTNYRYNTLNQVMAQSTPDAGQSNFWYDRLGRLVVSQNARQKAAAASEAGRQYSYTQYDYLGRINEVGQLSNTLANGSITDAITRNASLFNTWMLNLSNNKEQVTRTYYDLAYPYINVIPLNATNLRNRVAYTTLTNNYSTSNYNQASFYSYDIHGNVDTLLQDYGASNSELTKNIMNRNSNRWARIVYQYDLISGKVNHVAYNPVYYDVTLQRKIIPANQFYHRYSYDAENRLTTVETSNDSVIWEKDARYYYYKHGPLARMLIGDQQVQGLDYAYTLQGWLKGVNSSAATSNTDMGEDGKTGQQNIHIARDVLGYSLNYFAGDYASINNNVNPFPGSSGPLNKNYRPLYNGNISSMTVNIKPLGTPYLYNYKYDQLNRLTGMDAFTGLDTINNNWTALTPTNAYKERVSYDGNGNIKRYTRYFDFLNTPMDSLTYNYLPGSNKLGHVIDNSQGWVNGNRKIKNQLAGNYAYDEIGNLTQDISENIPAGGIKWNVYGKITEINHSVPGVLYNAKKINYTYDAAGNRIGKKVIKFGSPTVSYTWYVRDAAGNVLHEYTAIKDTIPSDSSLSPFGLVWAGSHVYGSSRLGVQNQYLTAEPPYGQGATYNLYRGQKFYEISNHLGNVLAVVSDKKIGHTSNGTTLDYYQADIIKATDYYPFGMVSRNVNRTSLGLNYHYGFNGKENDADVKGDGNQYDYGFRIYDPRLGRFLSTDPLENEYPWNSPYAFAENRPIDGRDLEGKEWENFMTSFSKPGSLAIKLPNKETAQIQHYSTSISNAKMSFADFKKEFKSSPQNILTNSKAEFKAPVDGEGKPSQFKVGSYIKIDIDGPMNNAYVKVMAIDEAKEGKSMSVTFATIEGHIEKGVINFTLTDKGDGKYDFSITSMSEVDMGMAPEKYSRSEQKKSWEEVLYKVVKISGGTETKRVEKVIEPKATQTKEEKK